MLVPLVVCMAFAVGVQTTIVLQRLVPVELNVAGADSCYRLQQCDPLARFRTINGACNNLLFPHWGQAATHYIRLLRADYSDGNSAYRTSRRGGQLPNVRTVRTTISPDVNVTDRVNTHMLMAWGQLVAHDTLLTNDKVFRDCCNSNQMPNRPAQGCTPIPIPANDSFYSQFNVRCHSYSRSRTTNDQGCTRSPVQQVNDITHYLDASMVYGSDIETSRSLREFRGGLLKESKTREGSFLPVTSSPITACTIASNNNICLIGGDIRVNQNPFIGSLSVLLFMEHNRVAKELAFLNPGWNDNRLYEEARRIVIAEFQHITYNEYLSFILGYEYYGLNDLKPLSSGYSTSYRVRTNGGTINSFAAAVWRSFHSNIQGYSDLVDEKRCPFSKLRLSDWLLTSGSVVRAHYNNILRGLVTQPEREYTRFFTEEITNYLFRNGRPFGNDLETLDLNRGRDHGLPSYNEFRVLAGLPRARSFQDLLDIMRPEHVRLLSLLYADVNDIDLYAGGLLESPVNGGKTGPTFQYVIAEQFIRWKVGDRFFYEHGFQTGSFTPAQLNSIRGVTLSGLICLNSNVNSMQPRAFVLLSNRNSLVPCSKIYHLDLRPWKS